MYLLSTLPTMGHLRMTATEGIYIQCPFIFEFIMIAAKFSWVNLNSRERRMQILGRDGLTFTPFFNHEL